MKTETIVFRSRIDAPAETVFRWHARPGAFERYNAPWNPVEMLERTGGIEEGARTVIQVRVGPLRRRWVAEHYDYQEGHHFRDRQLQGPFAHWDHLHLIEPDGPDACFLEDRIDYALPLGSLGRLLAIHSVRRRLMRTFAYRHRTLSLDLAAQRVCGGAVKNILISGSHGLVGSTLIPFLTAGGHEVTRLVRSAPASGEKAITWDSAKVADNLQSWEGFDAVIHLAGESIAAGRWNARKKARIRDSRVIGTRNLCDTLAKLDRPPRVLVCASAIGYYGDRGDEIVTEESAIGSGFLADVCREWEEAAEPARQKGIRVVHSRFGVILSPRGGALAKMLLPFKMGAGGKIGSGRQGMSWIAVDDAVGAIHHALHTESLHGPVNVVAPHPVSNYEFTKTLGGVLGRPTIMPMPAFAARIAFGEMANELLLAGAYVEPRRLLGSRYEFRHWYLEDALRHMLGRA